ncbi:MAG: capsular biosynthesis protein [Muribaculum sp.]|nr:capsular biosynthesis protein [Muribaculaceae bacterium]MCM1080551.1 capsular biosynthesis protein [Muribaculum sp.]
MWPFGNKKVKICQSGILRGFTDWHSHLLPGVDDGVAEQEESLAILELMASAGIKNVHLTPHIMEDVPNKPDNLRARFDDFLLTYNGVITLSLGAENMLDALFAERLEQSDLLPLSTGHILVETSFINPPMGFYDLLQQIKSAGFYPVLAHPERYRYMDSTDYERLLSLDIKLQLNVPSLVGFYGESAFIKARKLLQQDAYSYAGLDIHSIRQFQVFLDSSIESKLVDQLQPLLLRNNH